MHELSRIAIVNRGEAAMRLVHAVRELAHEHGRDIRSIALHTKAEARAMFVREADEAVCLDSVGSGSTSPYLDLVLLEAALVASRADAAWVGWGFVAERPEFAELCVRLGIVFVGPTATVMRKLGDKIEAKLLAEQAGVPVAPWSGGPVDSVEDARRHGETIGYPLMIKATAGGGGRGIRKVSGAHELEAAFESARAEGLKGFGDATVFMERVVTDARHVEVQIVGDQAGTVWALGVRDCSMQRRHQKVIEESSSTALDAAQDAELRASAVRLAQLAGYSNAGTVEFLYQPAERLFSFLEVNTRLQVEHPITEVTTGVDIVKLQLHVAAGGLLHGDVPPSSGHAMEARLNAEDPQRGFTPSPGRIEMFSVPVGPGIRVDTGVAEGDVIPPEYDSMIAKIIAWGADRDEARARLWRALAQTTVVVDGGTTNKAFLLELLDRPEVRSGDLDTGWLDRLTATDALVPVRHADVALVAAAIDAYIVGELQDRATFFEWAARGRPQAGVEIGAEIELRLQGRAYRVGVGRMGPDRFRVALDDDAVTVRVEPLGRLRSRIEVGGRTYRVVSSTQRADHLIEVDGVAHRVSRDDGGVLRAPAAALVVAVNVAVGDIVEAGAPVVVVEAMKMEIAIAAPAGGRVTEVLVARNVQVDAGAPLLRIEAAETGSAGDDAAETAGPVVGVTLGSLHGPSAGSSADRAIDALGMLRAFVLGFDIEQAVAAELLDVLARHSDLEPLPDAAELAVLSAFADVGVLTRDRRRLEGDVDELTSPREHFHTFLRSLDGDPATLGERFRTRLLHALAHYGVVSLDHTDRLEDALFRIFLANQRRGDHAAVVMALLDRRLRAGRHPVAPDAGEHVQDGLGIDAGSSELRDVLDRLVDATHRSFPAIANLARSVRFRSFDEPVVDRATRATHHEMLGHIAELATLDGDDARRGHVMDQLVACPRALVPIVARTTAFDDPTTTGDLLEVLVRRFYKIRDLQPCEIDVVDGRQLLRTAYEHNAREVQLVAAVAPYDEIDHVLGAIAVAARALEGDPTVVVDLFVTAALPGVDPDVLSVRLHGTLERAGLGGDITRVAFVVIPDERGVATQTLTFRRGGPTGERPFWMDASVKEGGFEEDVKFRGLHPMIARRLQMWRLANFDIGRLPAPADVHLFRCVARDSADDVRLVAVAEVRDLTPVFDASGRVVALPEVEHLLAGCLDSIREAAARLGGRGRMEWNRVMLFVWPVVELPLDELDEVIRRLAPLTEGLGIEQIVVQARLADATTGGVAEVVIRVGYEAGSGLTVRLTEPPTEPMHPLNDYNQKVIQARRRGMIYPYELLPMLSGPDGAFVELDLDPADGMLAAVDRPLGQNSAGVIVGIATTRTERHPEGMARIALLGDPTKAMGSISEPECRLLLAAIDLAAEMRVPIEWFALSAGAKISMESGSENLDWVARVLRRLVEHTQHGFEVNVVVAGINVGAQPYWNAESTMLMHTRGILVMTPESAMVLTGKQAIDYSGGVSAENNLGIGGYERIMGPNGEAQYWAPDLAVACEILHAHYDVSYVAPTERWPRRAATSDPYDRDVRPEPHHLDGSEFATVGDVFSSTTNPDRKKPFDIRSVIHAVIDHDHRPLERWPEMAEAETAVVYDARLGGFAATVIGIESKPLPRHGATPADGPVSWSAGTLFPLSSKKVARAINAASGNRPVVVLANLSGFDGSPESLRRLQLEYGAEIGRAIVNFDGPIVLCVVSRYHGGAFVVFSATLNDAMEVLAVEGSFASVIGGAPAAAVVFTGEVNARTRRDPRVQEVEARIAAAESEEDTLRWRAEQAQVVETVRVEKLGDVAAEFDAVHSVRRAQDVGSVHRIIEPAALRPELIAAIERGIAKFG